MHFGPACVALPSNLGSRYVVHPLHTLSLRQNENISKDVPTEGNTTVSRFPCCVLSYVSLLFVMEHN